MNIINREKEDVILSEKLESTDIDLSSKTDIMTVEEVAKYFQRSISWVYKNWMLLGGRKLGGSLFFPTKEDLYESIFQEDERVEVRFHSEKKQIHRPVVQNKKGGKKSRSRKTKGGTESDNEGGSPNRYGLLDVAQ